MACALATVARADGPKRPSEIVDLAAAPNVPCPYLGPNSIVFDTRVLSNGGTLRVGNTQVLYKRGMVEASAGELQVGDELDALFSFPDGYSYTSDDGQPLTSRASVVVTAVEPAGEADVFAFAVNRVGRFMFSAGVLGKANGL